MRATVARYPDRIPGDVGGSLIDRSRACGFGSRCSRTSGRGTRWGGSQLVRWNAASRLERQGRYPDENEQTIINFS